MTSAGVIVVNDVAGLNEACDGTKAAPAIPSAAASWWWSPHVTIAAALLMSCCVGTAYAFALITHDLKQQFTWSQSDIELISTVGNFGVYSSWVGGLILIRFGIRASITTGAVLSSSGYLLMWLQLREFLTPVTPWTFALAYCVAQVGAGVVANAAISIAVYNFPATERGSTIGLVKGMFALSSAIVGEFFLGFFNSNPHSYLLFLAVFAPSSAILFGVFVNVIPWSVVTRMERQRQRDAVTVAAASSAAMVANDGRDWSAWYGINFSLAGALAFFAIFGAYYEHHVKTIHVTGVTVTIALLLVLFALPFVLRANQPFKWYQSVTRASVADDDNRIVADIPRGAEIIGSTHNNLHHELLTDADVIVSDHYEEKHGGHVSDVPVVRDQYTASVGTVGAVRDPFSFPFNTTVLQSMQTPEFYMIYAVFCVGGGTGIMVIGNITQILRSLRPYVLNVAVVGSGGTGAAPAAAAALMFKSDKSMLVTIIAVSNFCGRIIWGKASDVLLAKSDAKATAMTDTASREGWRSSLHWNRAAILMLVHTCLFGTFVCLSLIPSSHHSLPYLACGCAMTGFSYGGIFSVGAGLIADVFGVTHFPSNYGAVDQSIFTGSILFSVLLAGRIYTAHEDESTGDTGGGHHYSSQQPPHLIGDAHNCTGTDCFRTTFWVCAAANAFMLPNCLLLAYRTRRTRGRDSRVTIAHTPCESQNRGK